jgi:beta-xylosidase
VPSSPLKKARVKNPCYVVLLLTFATFSCAVAAPPTTQKATAQATYTNPLNIEGADPFVIHYRGQYYCYATSANDGFKCWSSPDLVHWAPRGYAFQRSKKSWGEDFFWAPCVVQRSGKFFFYYSARGDVGHGNKGMRICVATSYSPTGPFHDVRAPMFDVGKSTIDAEAFIDNNGKAYMYYSLDYSDNIVTDPQSGESVHQSQIYVVPLAHDLMHVVSKPAFCIRPDHDWEGTGWNEGPLVFRYKDTYILMYSANAYVDPHYGLGYATSKSPLGPWTKSPDNPVLQMSTTMLGPGHNCVIDSPDGKELFCVYHVHKEQDVNKGRVIAIDRMNVTDLPDGGMQLHIDGPTSIPQPMPSGAH